MNEKPRLRKVFCDVCQAKMWRLLWRNPNGYYDTLEFERFTDAIRVAHDGLPVEAS